MSSNASSKVQSVKCVQWNNGVTIQPEIPSVLSAGNQASQLSRFTHNGESDAQINNSLNQALEKLETMKQKLIQNLQVSGFDNYKVVKYNKT